MELLLESAPQQVAEALEVAVRTQMPRLVDMQYSQARVRPSQEIQEPIEKGRTAVDVVRQGRPVVRVHLAGGLSAMI